MATLATRVQEWAHEVQRPAAQEIAQLIQRAGRLVLTGEVVASFFEKYHDTVALAVAKTAGAIRLPLDPLWIEAKIFIPDHPIEPELQVIYGF